MASGTSKLRGVVLDCVQGAALREEDLVCASPAQVMLEHRAVSWRGTHPTQGSCKRGRGWGVLEDPSKLFQGKK